MHLLMLSAFAASASSPASDTQRCPGPPGMFGPWAQTSNFAAEALEHKQIHMKSLSRSFWGYAFRSVGHHWEVGCVVLADPILAMEQL